MSTAEAETWLIPRTVSSTVGMGPAGPANCPGEHRRDAWLDAATNAIQVLVPYTAIGSRIRKTVGSLALTVFSTGSDPADGIHGSVPVQGATVDHPAFVSDMLMPLYPFDTPLTDPIIFYDMPAARWRMPYFDSVDGYQVQVARTAGLRRSLRHGSLMIQHMALLCAHSRGLPVQERVRGQHQLLLAGAHPPRAVYAKRQPLRLRAVVARDALAA